MKALRITGCHQPMWYQHHVGQLFPLVREYPEYYMSREVEGYVNIVHKCDAVVVEVTENGNNQQAA